MGTTNDNLRKLKGRSDAENPNLEKLKKYSRGNSVIPLTAILKNVPEWKLKQAQKRIKTPIDLNGGQIDFSKYRRGNFDLLGKASEGDIFFKKMYVFNGEDQYIDTGLIFPYGKVDSFSEYVEIEFLDDEAGIIAGHVGSSGGEAVFFERFSSKQIGLRVRTDSGSSILKIKSDQSFDIDERVVIGYTHNPSDNDAENRGFKLFANGVYINQTIESDDSDLGVEDFLNESTIRYIGAKNVDNSSAGTFINANILRYGLTADQLSEENILDLNDGSYLTDISENTEQEFLFDNDLSISQCLDNSGNNNHGVPINMLADSLKPEPEVINAAPSLLLDSYPFVLACDMRLIRSDYASFDTTVREDSGNTESNVGFDVSNNLDESALLSHVGAASGWVAVWKDQQNSYDFIRTVATRQPQIVNAGVINKVNSKPIINFSSGDGLQSSSVVALSGASEVWLFLVVNITDANSTQVLYESSTNGLNNTGAFSILIGAPNQYRIYQRNAADDGRLQVNFDCTIGQHLIVVNLKGGEATAIDSIRLWEDGVELTGTTSTENTSTNTYADHVQNLGARNGKDLSFKGGVQFVGIATGGQSANRASIETIINDYYSIY